MVMLLHFTINFFLSGCTQDSEETRLCKETTPEPDGTFLGSLQLAIDHKHPILCKCVHTIIITPKTAQLFL